MECKYVLWVEINPIGSVALKFGGCSKMCVRCEGRYVCFVKKLPAPRIHRNFRF